MIKYDYLRFFEDKLKELARENYILDIGGGHQFQKGMAKYQSLFYGKRYETMDNSPAYKPNIVGDIHSMPFKDGSIDAILCNSVFEHLYNPNKAMEEIYRVLKKGGKVLIYTHFIYPYHGRKGVYGDYFRFTEDSLRYLLRNFSQLEIKKQGGYFRALMFFLPLQNKLKLFWEPLAYLLDKLLRTETRSTTAGYYIYALK